jgi:HD superfamily phosphohydrolase
MVKTIRDSVHGSIKLSEVEVAVLDTPEMQRLRGIKQLGFTYLVYPGANHTRFEHSVGVLHLSGRFGEQLGEELEKIRLAGLLHDLGHLPFSHLLESVLKRNHEELTIEKITSGSIADTLKEHGFSPKEIAGIIRDPIISGPLGTDRLDYLIRDAYYSGVAYGVIDIDRLLDVLRKKEGVIIVNDKGVQTAESVLLARYLMFPTVYNHRVVRIAGKMLERALMFALEDGEIKIRDIIALKDQELLSLLKTKSYSKIVKKIENRELLKQARISKTMPKLSNEEILEFERKLEEKLGLQKGEVIIDLPGIIFRNEKIMLESGELKTPLVTALEKAYKEQAWTGVYSIEEKKKEVEKEVRNLF